ncbi:Ger(x)C family spore germination protein [Fictibacillus phosphorivorans]|uniref:Ger(x)C family spore germination protein n=1 Tax=Fictibacillus phosphorivorans TaxID=1221500 RepID=UPI00203D891B|nr:Ger(x)C family spore germination protein [Fictibacillus phosphorivorans]MCM3718665.1 Ger(x)C family spore germination protein [Fictibacillus phosphorivorans]MCM3776288.1 Ger(x)C family spore germination protein [Fictibacillus phosphorivorans]
MKKKLSLLSVLLLLTGCWDQNVLNKTKLITAGGFDYTKDGKIITTASVPEANAMESGKDSIENQIYTATGTTVRQSRFKLDREVSERLDISKNQIIILGEDAAKEDIYQLLDVFYRDPKSALNAKIAVAKGKASDVISKKFEETKKAAGLGEYLRDSILSAEESSAVPRENIQTVCPVMFDPGQDFALPYLEALKRTIHIRGVALFRGQKMVGEIKEPLSVTYTMLTGKKHEIAMNTTKKIYKNKKPARLNYVTIKVKKNKRSFLVDVTPEGKISAKIKLKTKVTITEYPSDNLSTPTEVRNIEKQLSKKLTKDAQTVIDKLQAMNSDPFGVGRQVMAFHYPVWERLNWEEEYPKIDFTASVDVEVIGHGIIE